MKRFLAALCVIAPMNARAAEPSMVFGHGNNPCSKWSDDGGNGLFSTVWVQGYWSALTLHPGYEHVGESLGAVGIVELVRQACKDSPDETIATATIQALQSDYIRRVIGD